MSYPLLLLSTSKPSEESNAHRGQPHAMAAQDPTASLESNGLALVITASILLVLTWISVSLRVYVRIFLTKGFLADDWLMVASLASFSTCCGFILTSFYYGLGRHNKSLDLFNELSAVKWESLATITYILNMLLVKMSIGIFLLRIATQRRYRYALYTSITIFTVWTLVLFFWFIFQCTPVEAQWDYTILRNDPSSHCVSSDEVIKAAYSLSVMSVLSDWFFALLPIPMVWSVKMTLQAKMTVVGVLGVGIFASIATLVRVKFLVDLTDQDDILYAMVWTLVEPGLAIIASSLATVRPLLRAWGLSGFQSTQGSQSGVSRNKIVSRAGRSRQSVTNKIPGFGSTDITLIDAELGYSKIDDGKSSAASKSTWGNTTTIKSQPSKSAMAMLPVEELAEERDVGTADFPASTTTAKKDHIRRTATSPELAEPGSSGIAVRRSTSIVTTPSNIATQGASIPPHNLVFLRDTDKIQDLDSSPSMPNNMQGRTWLSSDQASSRSSIIELTNMQAQQHDEADLIPREMNGRNRVQRH